MRGGRILWGQIAVVFTIVLVMTWATTQWVAFRLGFQSQLGDPWLELAGWPIYYPPAFFWWLSMTGEAMFRSLRSAKVFMTGMDV